VINFLIILFIITLLYLAKNELIKHYIFFLSIQGFILFLIAILELKQLDASHLILILAETLFFKAIFVPVFLQRLVKLNNLKRKYTGIYSGNVAIGVAVFVVIASFSMAHALHDEHLQIKYFAAAISAVCIGLFVAINHRDIISHLIGFLILENGIFLLSLALGAEMPMFVNAAIFLDIFTTVLIMGIFFNKVREFFQDDGTDKLTKLKD
jgi:hydrogenase-4 component E